MTLITRIGCHLCDEARAVISEVCGSVGVGWDAVDVDQDPRLAQRYTDHVPVVLVDGVVHSYWFVDADQLLSRLQTSAS